jgi:hypothetical protein
MNPDRPLNPDRPRRPWRPPPGLPAYPGVLSPDAPLHAAASLLVLAAGGRGEPPASTVTLVRDGAALIVVNPGAVAGIEPVLRPLRELGIAPAAVTDLVLIRLRPGHTASSGLFPGARLHGAGAGGTMISPSVRLIAPLEPLAGDLTALVATWRGIIALTHLWRSGSDGTHPPDLDPAVLHQARLRVLGTATHIIPAHGPPFRAGPDTPV